MESILIFNDSDKKPCTATKHKDCLVCQASDEKYANEIEKIFSVVNTNKNIRPVMCDPHYKKTMSLKIVASKNELFELDSSSDLKKNPLANKITEEEYDKPAELIEIGEPEDDEVQDVSNLLL